MKSKLAKSTNGNKVALKNVNNLILITSWAILASFMALCELQIDNIYLTSQCCERASTSYLRSRARSANCNCICAESAVIKCFPHIYLPRTVCLRVSSWVNFKGIFSFPHRLFLSPKKTKIERSNVWVSLFYFATINSMDFPECFLFFLFR